MTTQTLQRKSALSESIPEVEISVGGGTYIVNGYFKLSGKTASEKIFDLMVKDVENLTFSRYNKDIPQESFGCRRIKEDMI